MRHWNRLSLTLPLGLAVAALYVPLRLADAADSPPTAIQAALRVGPGETTPHFFTGDTRLSSFQRLPEPIQHPLQPTAVTAVPVPNVEQRPVEQPRPGLSPTMINAVTTAQMPRQQAQQSQQQAAPIQPMPPQPQPQIDKPIAWVNEHEIDAHFFPNHSPLRFAAYLEPVMPPSSPSLVSEAAPQTARLRTAEIQPVGVAQVAIAPAQPPPAISLPPAPLPTQRPTPPANASFASMSVGPPADQAATAARPANAAALVRLPSESPAIRPTISLAPELVEPTSVPPELAAPATTTAAFENKRLRGPHFSLGPMRLASLERQPTNLQAPPLKEAFVLPAAAPNLPPPDSAFPTSPTTPAPLAITLPTPVKPQLTSLETRSASTLNPTALAALPPPSQSLTPIEPELTSLRTHGPEPIAPLVPTEVLPAASPPRFREHFQLTALQPLPSPGVNLQPTEVLPLPYPYNPTAPRVPTAIDTERPISAVSSNITNPSGRMPTDLAVDRFRGEYPPNLPRDWEDSMYFWDAPTMCIGPLRYEEVNLERFGYSHCPAIQPVLSGMHFLGATLALPYSIAARPFGTCEYPLGHYRPGSPVPFRHIRPELRPWPAAVECMTIAGLILLIP